MFFRERSDGRTRDDKWTAGILPDIRKDIFRPVAMFVPTDTYMVPDTLKKDVDDFCEIVKEELPNADFFKSAGVRGGHRRTIIEATREYFYVITRNGSLFKYYDNSSYYYDLCLIYYDLC